MNFGYALGVVCAVWVIYDVWTQNKVLSDNQKLFWTVMAVLFNVITAVFYYITQKRNI